MGKLAHSLTVKQDILKTKFKDLFKVDYYVSRIDACLFTIDYWCGKFLIKSRAIWWDIKGEKLTGMSQVAKGNHNDVIRAVFSGIVYVKYYHEA